MYNKLKPVKNLVCLQDVIAYMCHPIIYDLDSPSIPKHLKRINNVVSTQPAKRQNKTLSNMTTQQKDLQMRMTLTKAHHDFEKLLKARAMFKVSDASISDDLVQMTFMKTWTYLVKGGKIDTMKAFLYHVLNGLIIDEYRKSKPTSLDILLEKGFDPYFIESDRLTNKIDGRKAVVLIDRLPKNTNE